MRSRMLPLVAAVVLFALQSTAQARHSMLVGHIQAVGKAKKLGNLGEYESAIAETPR